MHTLLLLKLAFPVTNACHPHLFAKQVQYVITTDEEIAVNPTKIQEAKVKGLPMVSEDVLSAAIKAGAMPDLTPYLLTGSPSAAPASAAATAAAAKKATAAKAAAAGKKATAAKSTAAVEDDDEEEEEVKPKRGAAAKKSAKKASAAMDVDEPAAAPAPKTTAAAKRTAKETAAAPSRASTTSSAEPTLTRAPTTLDMTEKKSEVVFSFDTTGSMYPCLTQVRRKIQECVKRLFDEIGRDNLRIGITAHGDYCDAGMTYVTKHLPMTDDLNKIVNFVENVSGTGGGDAPECYELVLHEALSYNWTKGWNHVLVLIGDELPHEANANPGKLDWKEECKKLQAAGVQVHGVQALNRKHATKFYAGIANLTGGVHLPLDQFSAITDLVVAVCFREARPAQLEKFEKEVQAGGRYNRTIQVMFDRMLGRTTKAGEAPGDMNAVHAGRFQVLDVDHDVSIKDFVLAQGVTFKTGRGFYEFTKPETIQGYKEIILMDPSSGEMFEGDYARTLINAPAGVSARVVPKDLDFIPFIQSTSHNRKLIGGTRFLYEIEEGF